MLATKVVMTFMVLPQGGPAYVQPDGDAGEFEPSGKIGGIKPLSSLVLMAKSFMTGDDDASWHQSWRQEQLLSYNKAVFSHRTAVTPVLAELHGGFLLPRQPCRSFSTSYLCSLRDVWNDGCGNGRVLRIPSLTKLHE